MNKPMLVGWGAGNWGVVTSVEETTTESYAVMRLKRANTEETRFELELSFDAMNGRKVLKAITLNSTKPISRETLAAVCQQKCEAIGQAQIRARQLAHRRKAGVQMPRKVAKAAVREIFPEDRPTKAQWLARVRSCAGLPESVVKALEEQRLVEFVQQGDYKSLEEYAASICEMHERPAGTIKRALNLFLFSHWQTITQPGMTSEKVYNLAVKTLGASIVGDLEAFRKFLQRRGVRFRAPGRPNK